MSANLLPGWGTNGIKPSFLGSTAKRSTYVLSMIAKLKQKLFTRVIKFDKHGGLGGEACWSYLKIEEAQVLLRKAAFIKEENVLQEWISEMDLNHYKQSYP